MTFSGHGPGRSASCSAQDSSTQQRIVLHPIQLLNTPPDNNVSEKPIHFIHLFIQHFFFERAYSTLNTVLGNRDTSRHKKDKNLSLLELTIQ